MHRAAGALPRGTDTGLVKQAYAVTQNGDSAARRPIGFDAAPHHGVAAYGPQRDHSAAFLHGICANQTGLVHHGAHRAVDGIGQQHGRAAIRSDSAGVVNQGANRPGIQCKTHQAIAIAVNGDAFARQQCRGSLRGVYFPQVEHLPTSEHHKTTGRGGEHTFVTHRTGSTGARQGEPAGAGHKVLRGHAQAGRQQGCGVHRRGRRKVHAIRVDQKHLAIGL